MIGWRALLPLVVVATAACDRGATGAEAQSPPPAQRQQAQTAIAGSRRTALVDATKRVAPAVVSISVTSKQQVSAQSPFDLFFMPEGTERTVQGFGTGFVVRPNGIILTNAHVVSGATSVTVTLADGTDAQAKVIGEDPTTDIAVIKVDRTGLPTVTLGHGDDLMIGEWVVALGNPYAYFLGNPEPTVTIGVVSATGRNILPTREQTALSLDMIQTDAAINPGNSGGPLANALGEVVGVNSSILSNSGGSIGLGFAIPIERAVRVMDEILKNGTVRRAWVGLDVTGPESMSDWRSRGGVVVQAVAPGGPAARAGLKPGDVLVEANGRRLRNFLDWEAVKLDLHVGDVVTVEVKRGTGTVERTITTGDLPTVTAERVKVGSTIELVTLTPAIKAEKGVRSDNGALIVRIAPETASATGLHVDDVIVGINRTPVRSAEQVSDILESRKGRSAFRVYVERGGDISFVDLVFQ